MTSQSAKRRLTSPAVIAFAAAFVAFLVVALLQGEKPFYYDSGTYWSLSDSFVKNGHFSFLNFENTGLRGYALPLIYFLVQKTAGVFTSNTSLMVMVFNSAVFALIGAVLAPRLARIAWPAIEWSILRRLLLCGLILFFWRGFLSFPLSDFPALAAALLALIAVSRSDSLAWMAVAGLAAGLALDIRPAYLLLVPIVLVLAAWNYFERQRRLDLAAGGRLALFIAALILVSLPQSLSQHRYFDSYTPIPGGSSLVGLQYTEGLRMQRYDTYVGGTIAEARMTYVDHHTDAIVYDLDGGSVKDTGQYAKIVLEHPITMAGVFLRHIVNGLDQRYTTPYVEHLQTGWNRPGRILGFLIVFLALVRVIWPAARRRLQPARWRYPAALLLCCATSAASAVETRFLLPVFLLCAMLVVVPGWPNPIGPAAAGLRRYRALAVMIATGIVFFAIVWTIVSGATDSLRLGVT